MAALKRFFKKRSDGGLFFSRYQHGPDEHQRLMTRFAVYGFLVKDRETLRRLKITLNRL
ncbi:hypothetical protein J7K07_04630 [Candidatus Bathyarchaeota archaeon]|nr:hypothetical protein [Candidatus Bathyarchaeota archaeon]